MKWDFSLVKAQGDVKDIEAALHQHLISLIVRLEIRRFRALDLCWNSNIWD